MTTYKSKGFTLIELIVVMVILGILAAFALPKFFNFRADAQVASANGLAAALRSAGNMSYQKALVTNQTGLTGVVNLGDGSPISTVYGYPAAEGVPPNGSIVDAVSFDSGVFGTPDCGSGACTFTINGDPLCTVIYNEPASSGAVALVGIDCAS